MVELSRIEILATFLCELSSVKRLHQTERLFESLFIGVVDLSSSSRWRENNRFRLLSSN